MIKFTLLIFVISLNAFASSEKVIEPNYFEANYNSYYQGDNVGYLNRIYTVENNKLKLYSTSDISGTYGFLPVSDKREEYSVFTVSDNGIYKPEKYYMKRTGTWLDFEMDINFDYEKKKVNMKYKDRNSLKDLKGEVLDNALFQLKMQQQVKNGNRKDIEYDVAFKTGFRNFHFKYLGEDIIEINGSKIKTLKYKQVRSNKSGSKKATYSWFYPEKDFIMARFIYYNDDGEEEARFDLKEYKKTQ